MPFDLPIATLQAASGPLIVRKGVQVLRKQFVHFLYIVQLCLSRYDQEMERLPLIFGIAGNPPSLVLKYLLRNECQFQIQFILLIVKFTMVY